MELVAENYKETEVGLIPNDWEVKTIGEIFTFYSTSNYSKAEMSLYGDVGCVHYGLIHAIENSYYSLSSGIKYYVTKEQAKYEAIQEGDVIMVDASEDLVGLNKSVEVFDLNNKEYIAGLHTFHLRDNNSTYVATFRGLILNSNSVKKQMLRFAVGMKVFGVSKPQLQNIFIPVPTKAEQAAIATALSDADALISGLEKLIAKKRNIKQGAMQKLLQPKEGWEVKKLPEIVWFQEGPGVRNSQFTSSGVKLLNGTNIEDGKLLLDKTDRYISVIEAYGWYSHFLVDDGDILIACSGVTIDKFDEKVTVASITHLPLCMNTSTMRFKIVSSSLSKSFFLHFLKSKSFKQQIGGKATGSAQLNFGPSHVKMVDISLPNFEDQETIATILSDMDDEITALETKLEKYKKVKLGMMQNLLTGKIRLI